MGVRVEASARVIADAARPAWHPVGMAISPRLTFMVALLVSATAAARGPIIDVHVHTEPKRFGLVADVLAANGVTRFINLSGGSGAGELEDSLAAAAPHVHPALVAELRAVRLSDTRTE